MKDRTQKELRVDSDTQRFMWKTYEGTIYFKFPLVTPAICSITCNKDYVTFSFIAYTESFQKAKKKKKMPISKTIKLKMVSLNWIHDFKPNLNYFIHYQ